jgi:hypothetical protein
MKTVIECSTCGYPLTPEEREGLVEIDGKMCKPIEPLTDEEIDKVTDAQWAQNNHKPIYAAHRAYARAIERAHGIGGEE